MADDALLIEVSETAGAALQSSAEDDDADDAQASARNAARTALDAGHSIAAIAAASNSGERAARERVGGQVLRAVERSGRKLREATAEHEQAIAHAVRLGLAARDIAARAGVSHGTVAAVARRHEQASTTPPHTAAPGAGSTVDRGPAAESEAD